MCLAVPAQIVEREDMVATVDVGGVRRQVSMMLLPEAKIGDYVLIHAGFAMQQIDEEEAKLTWSLLQEMAEHVQNA
ncbi:MULTISPECIES: HypC/HybG/HupF family hydrogenase formation chaperone [Sporomusaceae]|uniref:HypC/HybG/HupF family hydrogenase formation chaperone n=1 Tax=Sporomusaceae TaxID=1843490 RepID=UPI00036191DB|nr:MULTISPECIES: HypC/HybG/HupF family hydrogenase formation chaperone [Sporomusaceae]